MTKNEIVIIDIDDVCADLLTTWLECYNCDWNDHITKFDIKSWEIDKYVKPECGKKIFEYIKDASLYYGVQPIENALEGVNFLRELGFNVVFCTMVDWGNGKYKWMKEHEFTKSDEEFIVCKNKSLIRADMMIDDNTHYVQTFKGSLAILFSQPHNYNFYWPHRVGGWKHIIDSFTVHTLTDTMEDDKINKDEKNISSTESE